MKDTLTSSSPCAFSLSDGCPSRSWAAAFRPKPIANWLSDAECKLSLSLFLSLSFSLPPAENRARNWDTLGHCQGTYPPRACTREEGSASFYPAYDLTQTSLRTVLCSPRFALALDWFVSPAYMCMCACVRLSFSLFLALSACSSRRRYRDRCATRVTVRRAAASRSRGRQCGAPLRELTASGVMTDSSWCTASADVDENGDAKVKSQMERRYSLRGRLLTNNDTVIMHYTPMIDRRVIFNSIVLQTTASAEWRTGWRWLGRGRAIAFDVTWCLREEPRL